MAITPSNITVPSPPTTADSASRLLSLISAQTGVITDLNVGSIVRTLAEAIGSVISINAVELQAIAFQALIYGGFSAFNVTPLAATPALGILTFSTGSPGGSSSPSPTNVSIPAGTVVQTTGGLQYSVLTDTTLTASASAVTANAQSILGGTTYNVGASTITQIVSPLQAVLYVTNYAGFTGGTNAETSQQTASRFANVVNALQLSSPQAVAGAALGVMYGTETVLYATCYEGWLAGSPSATTVFFDVVIDNGAGAASSGLISAVTDVLNGDLVNFTTSGYRPAGVPFAVIAVGPVSVNVSITADTGGGNTTVVSNQITSAVDAYFQSLNFGATAQLSVLSTQVTNAVANEISSITVELLSGITPETSIAAPPTGRVILQTLTLNVT